MRRIEGVPTVVEEQRFYQDCLTVLNGAFADGNHVRFELGLNALMDFCADMVSDGNCEQWWNEEKNLVTATVRRTGQQQGGVQGMPILSSVISEFMDKSRNLCNRLRSPEAVSASTADLNLLREQLKALDFQVSSVLEDKKNGQVNKQKPTAARDTCF